MIFLFWLSVILLIYAYLGYPMILLALGRVMNALSLHNRVTDQEKPTVAMIIPVYNEERIIEAKIKNSLSLEYPWQKCEVIIVSDGSTDRTEELVRQHQNHRLKLFSLPARQGKAAALNTGVMATTADIVVFSDASIMLDPQALENILEPFRQPEVGCVSGEDHISGGGEGLYGKYELFLRNLESRVNSIVGASGCFYAQRRSLCEAFIEGMAPDFLSVLMTVEQGYRAVTCPSAIGYMQSVSAHHDEYARKVRTFVRGMTTLFHFRHLLNPFRSGFFAVELISHKLMRWFSGLFLILLFISNMFLLGSQVYAVFFVMQILFYSMAIIGWKYVKVFNKISYVRIAFYFCLVNIAALNAWFKYLGGVRQELWEPSKR